MGQFSWITQDTGKRIIIENAWGASNPQEPPVVIMTDDKGNQYKEEHYEGYGVFGGKDYFELLAEMNGKKTREEGINLAYGAKEEDLSNQMKYPRGDNPTIKHPSLSESGRYFDGKPPETDSNQGWLDDDEDYEEQRYWDEDDPWDDEFYASVKQGSPKNALRKIASKLFDRNEPRLAQEVIELSEPDMFENFFWDLQTLLDQQKEVYQWLVGQEDSKAAGEKLKGVFNHLIDEIVDRSSLSLKGRTGGGIWMLNDEDAAYVLEIFSGGKMSSKKAQHMEPRVEFGEWALVEDMGETRWIPGEYEDLPTEPEIGPEGKVIERTRGWGAYMTAPGYLDMSDIEVFETEEEAWGHLKEYYMDDDMEVEAKKAQSNRPPILVNQKWSWSRFLGW